MTEDITTEVRDFLSAWMETYDVEKMERESCLDFKIRLIMVNWLMCDLARKVGMEYLIPENNVQYQYNTNNN
jgi:hypothetical protein